MVTQWFKTSGCQRRLRTTSIAWKVHVRHLVQGFRYLLSLVWISRSAVVFYIHMYTYVSGKPRPNFITHEGGSFRKHSKTGRGHSTNEISVPSSTTNRGKTSLAYGFPSSGFLPGTPPSSRKFTRPFLGNVYRKWGCAVSCNLGPGPIENRIGALPHPATSVIISVRLDHLSKRCAILPVQPIQSGESFDPRGYTHSIVSG